MKDKTSILWVMMNMAMTADGKTSGPKEANGFPKTPSMSRFSSKADHRRLLQIRATTDAVMSGRATVESDAIDLGPGSELWQRERCRHGREACNKRIVVSASGRIQPKCLIYQNNCSPLLIATTDPARDLLRARDGFLRQLAVVPLEPVVAGAPVLSSTVAGAADPVAGAVDVLAGDWDRGLVD